MNIYLEVYGCTANKSDASLIKGLVQENNHYIVENEEEADSIIIHTCTVIDTTEQRMLSRLRSLQTTDKQIIVTGCMASAQADIITQTLPDAPSVVFDEAAFNKPAISRGVGSPSRRRTTKPPY